jgi:hypothetical protein
VDDYALSDISVNNDGDNEGVESSVDEETLNGKPNK